jgi:hypothetical protein
MNLERGFKRLTCVLSCLGPLIFIALGAIEVMGYYGDKRLEAFYDDILPVVIFSVISFALVWSIYWALRWIIIGFKENSKNTKI